MKKAQDTKILFIGNSFSGRNDLPGLLTKLAASAPAPKLITTKQILSNGASLRQHWNAGVALETIEAERWDYVVLQEQSTLPLKNAKRFHENVRLFAEAINKCGAKPVLYLTWARQQAPETQTALTEATQAIATEIGALIVPVGTVWEKSLAEKPELALHDKDGSHPSPLGSYLAACVFYQTLFRASPVGLAIPERLKIRGEQANAVQLLAIRKVS